MCQNGYLRSGASLWVDTSAAPRDRPSNGIMTSWKALLRTQVIGATGKRQPVAVRIGHVEIAFSPRSISWNLRIKSAVLQMVPEGVHIGDVEDQPPPANHRLTLFQLEDRRLCVSCAAQLESFCQEAYCKFG
jgi:hypothetical protein